MPRDYRNTVRSAASTLAADGSQAADYLTEQVSRRAQEIGETAAEMANEYYREGRRALRHSAHSLEEMVEEHPVRSALVAVGIGCLIAACLWRK